LSRVSPVQYSLRRTMEVVVTSFFYRPDALPVTQPTVSKHWMVVQNLLQARCVPVTQPKVSKYWMDPYGTITI